MTNECSSSDKTTCSEGTFCPSNVASTSTPCIKCKDECATCTGTSAEDATCLTCADGKYLSGEACADCDSKCTTCTGSEDTACQSCTNGNVQSGSTCATCVSGQTTNCTCDSAENCSTCANDMSKCATCINDYDPNGETPCEKCKEKFFEDTSATPSKCTSCSNNCTACTSSSVCTTCDDGFSLINNKCVACTESQATACTCKAAKNCQTCNSSEMGKCKTCIGNFDVNDGTPCQNCLVGFFKGGDSGTDTCTACDGKCATCTALNTCQTCKDGNVLTNSTCVPCSTNQMTACKCQNAKNCSTCETDTSKCKTCINNFDPSGDTPCDKCVAGFFKDAKDGNDTCTACSENCTTCSSSSACTVCKDGFSIDSSKCVACTDENCTTCPTNKDTCTACKDGFSVKNSKCEKKCTAGDGTCAPNQICDTICKDCAGNCATCKGAVSTCVTCEAGFMLNSEKCTACPDNCANCDDNKDTCKVCKDDFFATDKTCTACTQNKIKQCKCGAATNCATCDSSNKGKCGTCITGYKKASDSTCSICDDGYLMVDMACQKCEAKCAMCSESLETCDTCAIQHTMSINQTCEKDCTGTLAEGKACTAEAIVDCGSSSQVTACKCDTAANCLQCNSSDSKKCASCMPGYKLENEKCTTCADGATAVGSFCFLQGETLSTNLSSGAVAGIVIAVLVVAGGVAGAAFWYMKKSKANQKVEKQNFNMQ
ncbi:Cysteine-rich membrane protein 2 [Spironucleus salmonicida]|uniref:Cysteine-rich membrane protein 2 n=1 Tax=Spironucleus salmonicida TaxID=348837 RepID=V6LQZ0_9EUKA|nr:Cysteine-rich membrane protein 2 [Spironucleus salmonicida]|eukprot:EST43164.1 Cysteine-rich membrane protein 2 [Spironucleus salmonicida]